VRRLQSITLTVLVAKRKIQKIKKSKTKKNFAKNQKKTSKKNQKEKEKEKKKNDLNL